MIAYIHWWHSLLYTPALGSNKVYVWRTSLKSVITQFLYCEIIFYDYDTVQITYLSLVCLDVKWGNHLQPWR